MRLTGSSDAAVPTRGDDGVAALRIDGRINGRQLQGKASQRHDSLVFIDNYICSRPRGDSVIEGILGVLNLTAVIRFVNLRDKANRRMFYSGNCLYFQH